MKKINFLKILSVIFLVSGILFGSFKITGMTIISEYPIQSNYLIFIFILLGMIFFTAYLFKRRKNSSR